MVAEVALIDSLILLACVRLRYIKVKVLEYKLNKKLLNTYWTTCFLGTIINGFHKSFEKPTKPNTTILKTIRPSYHETKHFESKATRIRIRILYLNVCLEYLYMVVAIIAALHICFKV